MESAEEWYGGLLFGGEWGGSIKTAGGLTGFGLSGCELAGWTGRSEGVSVGVGVVVVVAAVVVVVVAVAMALSRGFGG